MTPSPLYAPLQDRVLVEAGAGTGKTYTLAGLFVRLLLERDLLVENILVVTFTKAATEELKTRIRSNIVTALNVLQGQPTDEEFFRWLAAAQDPSRAVPRLRRALADFDLNAVLTIHGFCQRILTEHAFLSRSPFDPEIIPSDRELVMEIARDFWRRETYAASPLFVHYLLKEKCSPDSLVRSVAAGLNHPKLVVLPESAGPEESGPGTLEAVFLDALRRVRCAWPAARDEVNGYLCGSDDLNRRSYRTASMPGLIASMDLLLESTPQVPLFDGFERFTRQTMQRGLKKGCALPGCAFYALCDELLHAALELEHSFGRRVSLLSSRLYATLRRELSFRKSAANQLGFGDLLERAHESLLGPSGPMLADQLRSRLRAALIDEFQDTDPLQYAIFKTIFEHRNTPFYLIGDPKQAIYSFRGADVHAYLLAAQDCPAQFTLATNYRSVPSLLGAVNQLFGLRSNQFSLPGIRYSTALSPSPQPEDAPGDGRAALRIAFLQPEPETKALLSKEAATGLAARTVASEIRALLDHGTRAGDIAVLVRTNIEALTMRERLADLAVASVLFAVGSVYQTEDAHELALVLRAVSEPGNPLFARSALCTLLLRGDPAAFEQYAPDQSALSAFQERLHEYHELWAGKGFIQMVQRLLTGEGIRARLLSLPAGERRLTNLLHLTELLHAEEAGKHLGISGLIKRLLLRIEAEDMSAADEHQLRLESDRFAVTIMTVHRSKGLEFPLVFCPFLFCGSKEPKGPPVVFHSPGANGPGAGPLVMDVGSETFEQSKRLALRESLAEDLRLFYVALTRARLRCSLVWGAVNGAYRSALGYLLASEVEIADDLDPLKRFFEQTPAAELLTRLQTLAAESGGAIEVTAVSSPPLPATDRSEHACDEELSCRTFRGSIERSFRIASFTSLNMREELPFAGGGDEPEADPGEPTPAGETSGMEDFPRGAWPGTFIHALLEEFEFTTTDPDHLRGLVRSKLELFGFEAVWEDALVSMLDRVRTVRLDPQSGLTLSRVERKDRLAELEFFHPLKRITPGTLAELFAKGGSNLHAFADSLRRLQFSPQQGFMRGFIDLVFGVDGRYALIDWKSNHLGPGPGSYAPGPLRQAMEEGGYILQYHLYTLALNRYLRQRVPGYEYDQAFGGIYYVFVRGIDPARGPGWSVFHDRPDPGFVAMLDRELLG
jgi:exodeoxyribonuclease V beta subunit